MAGAVAFITRKEFDDNISRIILMTIDIVTKDGTLKYTMLDLLSDVDNFKRVCEEYPINIDELNGYPVIVFNEEILLMKRPNLIIYDVQRVENVFLSGKADKAGLYEWMVKEKEKKGTKETPEHIAFFLDFLESGLRPYYDKKLSIKIPYRPAFCTNKRHTQIKTAIDELHHATSMSAAYIGTVNNVAVKQETPTDRFFIPLPAYEEFKSEVTAVNIIPDMRSLFTPFKHKAYYNPLWRILMGQPEAKRRQIFMEENQRKIGPKFNRSEISSWVEHPMTHVEGDTDNDELPIMDNEKEWYDCFIKFMKMDLVESCGEQRGQEMFDAGALSPEMEYFYDSILDEILLLNWSCAGRFKISAYSGVDDEDENDTDRDIERENDTERNTGMELSMYYTLTNPQGFDGLEAVRSHIKRVARGSSTVKGTGCKTYAEAIIKLARWGERRPANLKLEGEPLFFNLMQFSTQGKTLNFDKMTVKKINGRSLSLIGLIRLTWKLQDTKYWAEHDISGKITDVPVGVIAMRSFEGERELSQVMYVSLLDVLAEYEAGNQFIDGIDRSPDGTYTVNASMDGYTEDLAAAMSDAKGNQDCTLYISKELEEFARETGQKARDLTELMLLIRSSKMVGGAITTWFDRIHVTDKQSLAQCIVDIGMPASQVPGMCILKHILPLYFKYSDEIRKHEFDGNWTVGDSFTEFRKLSQQLSIKNSTEFFKIGDNPQTIANTTKKLEAFGAVQAAVTEDKPTPVIETKPDLTPEVKAESSENIMDKILKSYICTDTGIVKMVKPVLFRVKAPGTGQMEKRPLAYFGQAIIPTTNGKTTGVAVLFSENEVPAGVVKDTTALEFSAFTMHLFNIIGDIFLQDTAEIRPLMFASSATAKNIMQAYAGK